MSTEMGNQIATGPQGSASEQDNTEATKTSDNSLDSLITSDDVNGLDSVTDCHPDSLQALEQHHSEDLAMRNSLNEPPAPNDADGLKPEHESDLSAKFEDSHEKPMGSAHEDTPADDDLIHRQRDEGQEEEEKRTSVFDTLSINEDVSPVLSVHMNNDKQEVASGVTCNESSIEGITEERFDNEEGNLGSDEKVDDLDAATVERMNKNTATNSYLILQNNEHDMPKEDKIPCGEKVFIDSDVVKENNEGNGEQQLPEVHIVGDSPTSRKEENVLSTEPINNDYLDAIDSEIKNLLMKADPDVVDKPSKTELEEYVCGLNPDENKCNEETANKEVEMDDTKVDNSRTQVKLINYSQEEKLEITDGGIDELMIEQTVQTDETKMIQAEFKEQQDYSPSLMTKEFNDISGEGVVTLEVEATIPFLDASAEDIKIDEKTEPQNEESSDENEPVEHDEICEERTSEFSSLTDPIANVSKETVIVQTEDLIPSGKVAEEEATVSNASGSETKLWEDNGVSGEKTLVFTSDLLDPIEIVGEEVEEAIKKSNAMRNFTGQKQADGGFVDPVKQVQDAVLFEEEHVYEINLVERVAPPPPLAEPSDLEVNIIQPHHVFLDCIQKFEQELTAGESEACNESNLKVSSLTDVVASTNIFSEITNHGDETFVSAIESDYDKHLQDPIIPSSDQMMRQEAEVLKVEYSEMIMASAVQSQCTNQECNSLSTAPSCIPSTKLKSVESMGKFAIESNQEKLDAQANNTIGAASLLEEAGAETLTSEAESQKEDCEEMPLLPPKESIMSLGFASVSNISALEVRTEEPKQDPLMEHEKRGKSDGFGFARSIPEIDDNMTRHNTEARKEVIGMAGAEATVSMAESSINESDKSPLLSQRELQMNKYYSPERSDSRKLTTPLQSLMNEEVYIDQESREKRGGLILKDTVDAVWQSPAKKPMATSPRERGKQKAKSSLFSSWICCTRAMN